MNTQFKKLNLCISVLMFLALVVGLSVPSLGAKALGATVLVDNLQPSWTAPGGGGVWAAYYAPDSDSSDGVTPGSTAIFDDREAGIIKAGLTIETSGSDIGHYKDEGLLAFKVASVDISTFAGQVLTYDVENETGTNPVWVRIRLVGGTQYQFWPDSYGVGGGYHTINAAAGQWQLMDINGNGTGSWMSLADVATANPGAAIDRVYLTLGQGDSYNVNPGVGTVGWVDKVTIASTTYDFVVPTFWYVDPTGSDSNEGTLASPFLTIQHAIDSAASGDTIHVAAGTYAAFGISKGVTLLGSNAGIDPNLASRSPEAIVNGEGTNRIRISTTEPVMVDGFTLTGVFLDSYTANSQITYQYNIIDNMPGLMFFNSPDTFALKNNHIYDTLGMDDSLLLAGDWNGTSGTIATIQDNVVDNVVLDSSNTAAGFNLSSVSGTISGNTFDGIAYYGLLLANDTNVTVSGNLFDNITNPDPTTLTWGAGVRTYTPGANFGMNVTGNTFSNSYVGIGIRSGSDLSGKPVTIAGNTFTNDNTDIVNQGTTTTRLNLADTNIFDGVTLSAASTNQLYAISDKVLDAVDIGTYGPVILKSGNIYVTPNSYLAPTTTGPSIKRGIDAANPGDTVNVAAGTYPERVVIDKPLNLIGAGVTHSIIDATSFLTAGNVIDITALTGNTKIQGFDIKTGDYSNGIHAAGGTDAGGQIEILDNHIISTNFINEADDNDQFGIIAGYMDLRTLTINGNEISNTSDNSMLIEKQRGETQITGNTLNGAYPTIWFMTYNSLTVTTLQKVSGNIIDMSAAVAGTGGSGVAFNPSTSFADQTGRYDDVEISGNTITGLHDYSFKGISIGESSADGSGGITNLAIFGNTVSGTDGKGIQLYGHITGADIHNNTLTGLYLGIKAFSYITSYVPESNTIQCNLVTGASNLLVSWTGPGTFNVEKNWWGSSAGPNPAKMSANVDYTPWSADTTCTTFGAPVVNTTRSTYFGTIQSAINDAATQNGDTITVAPGTFNEGVTVNKSLTLNGAQAGVNACSRSASESIIPAQSGGNSAISITANNVTIDGFKIQGAGAAAGQTWGINAAALVPTSGVHITNTIFQNLFEGLHVQGPNTNVSSGMTVDQNSFFDDLGDVYAKDAGIWMASAPSNNLTITNNCFSGHDRGDGGDYAAVNIDFSTNLSITNNTSHNDGTFVVLVNDTTVTVSGNTSTNSGAGFNQSSTVFLGLGNNGVTIQNNSLDNGYRGVRLSNAFGTGLNQNVQVLNNTITNMVNAGILVPVGTISDSLVAHLNRITGNPIGVQNDNSALVVDASRNWWGAASGPGAVGPGTGDHVSTYVTYSPWCRIASCQAYAPVSLIYPTGTITTWTDTFHWTGVPAATYYVLQLTDSSNTVILQTTVTPIQGSCVDPDLDCVYSPSPSGIVHLPEGSYTWKVKDYAPAGGYGPFTAPMAFTYAPICLTLNITKSPSVGGTVLATTQNCIGGYLPGTTVHLTETPGTGYVFSNWSGAATGSTSSVDIQMDTAKSVTANFTAHIVLIAPSGVVSPWVNNFHWTGAPGMTYYLLQLYDSSNTLILQTTVSPSAGGCVEPDLDCNYSPSPSSIQNLLPGPYTWKMKTYISGIGYRASVGPMAFTAGAACYTLSTAVDPALSGTIDVDTIPNCPGGYTNGTVLQLTANPASGNLFKNWTGSTSGTTNPVSLTMTGNKSVTANFTPVPTLTAPTGTLSSWNDTFQWTGLPGVTYYLLQLYNSSNSLLLQTTVNPSQGSCIDPDLDCTYSPTPSSIVNLANGDYSWRVKVYNISTGYGTWTDPMPFTINRP